jgi:hypothetical protein
MQIHGPMGRSAVTHRAVSRPALLLRGRGGGWANSARLRQQQARVRPPGH